MIFDRTEYTQKNCFGEAQIKEFKQLKLLPSLLLTLVGALILSYPVRFTASKLESRYCIDQTGLVKSFLQIQHKPHCTIFYKEQAK